MVIKKKTSYEDINELIEFYSAYKTSDLQLKKLILINLKNLKKKIEKERGNKNE